MRRTFELTAVVCLAFATVEVARADDPPADLLLPYLERCCHLGQEFARSRLSCDPDKLRIAHRHNILISNNEGVSNITCTHSIQFCCEETLEREIHCEQGMNAAKARSVCSTQTDHTAKACCNWCRAGLDRAPSGNCPTLSPDVPMHVREAFASCCTNQPSVYLQKKCGNNDCLSKNMTCVSPLEMCAYDEHGCHYRCVESSMSCPVGYKMDDRGNCVDIDECALKTHSCEPNEICVNSSGSYNCKSCNC